MKISYDNVKEISLVTINNNTNYQDLLRVSKGWISYKINYLNDDEISWSFKTKNNEFYAKFEELIDTMNHEYNAPHKVLEDVYDCHFNIRITFNDNTNVNIHRNGTFYIAGLYNQAKAFLSLIPKGYIYSKLLDMPQLSSN